MTVNTSTSVASGIGNGATTVFPFNFKLVDEADLMVLDVTTADESFVQLVLNTDYTVQGVGDESGGSITLTTPLPIGHKVKMARELDILQQTDLRNQGKFFAETHEEAFDRFIMIAQQLKNGLDRSVKVPITSDTPADELYEEFKGNVAAADQAAATAVSAKNDAQAIADQFGDMDTAISQTESLRDQAAASAGASSASASAASSEAGRAEFAANQAESYSNSATTNADVYDDTAAGLAATAGGEQFQVLSGDSTEFIRYRHDAGPVATEVGRFPASAKISGLNDSLYSAAQNIGPADSLMGAGSGTAGAATYWYVNPLAVDFDRIVFTCYMAVGGTIRVLSFSRSGDDYTVEDYIDLVLPAGINRVELGSLAVQAGWHVGFHVGGGFLALQTGSDPTTGGYYSATGSAPGIGDVRTDGTPAPLILMARFDFDVQYASGGTVKELSSRVGDSEAFTGAAPVPDQFIGRPDGSTLETGSAAGSSHYVFESQADGDRYVSAFSVWATSAGAIQVGAWSESGGVYNRERFVTLNVSAGLNEFGDIGLILRHGERIGLYRGTAGIAFNAAGGEPTTYRQMSATTGTPGAIVSSNRFEFTAQLSAYTLGLRVSRLEEMGGAASLLPTYTYHAIWMLGESHCAGRGEELSPVTIPDGGGYVYRRASGEMSHLADPTGNDSTAIAGSGKGSFGPAAGRAILDATRGSIGAAIINSGLGSSTIGFQWASGGSGWTQAVADWVTAKSAMDALNKAMCGCSVVIAIGSNDAAAGTTKSAFKSGMIDLINRVRTEIGYEAPVLLLPTGPFANGTYVTEVAYIQDAQHELAKEVAGVRLITTATEYAADNGWFLDNVHFTQDANEIIGAALGVTAFARGTGLSV